LDCPPLMAQNAARFSVKDPLKMEDFANL